MAIENPIQPRRIFLEYFCPVRMNPVYVMTDRVTESGLTKSRVRRTMNAQQAVAISSSKIIRMTPAPTTIAATATATTAPTTPPPTTSTPATTNTTATTPNNAGFGSSSPPGVPVQLLPAGKEQQLTTTRTPHQHQHQQHQCASCLYTGVTLCGAMTSYFTYQAFDPALVAKSRYNKPIFLAVAGAWAVAGIYRYSLG
jgi:hypothetical protein